MKRTIPPDFFSDPNLDRKIANEPKDHIIGWGHDANPENDPTYPIKNWNGADHERLNYDKPPQQPVNIEVLHSNERPGVSSVFGTSSPPKRLSGKIRRYAFRHSESTYSHWVPLVLADRVGVIEAFIDDLRIGIVPNIFAEKGWLAEWKYNRKGLLQNVALGIVITSVVLLMLGKSKVKS